MTIYFYKQKTTRSDNYERGNICPEHIEERKLIGIYSGS